jgi:hypothetical protein
VLQKSTSTRQTIVKQEMSGEFLIRWSARLAVACYAARLMCDVRASGPNSSRIARWWWTIGGAIFLAHVASAFHFHHHWNHAAAFDETARRTEEMTGWNSGTGLYINEAFLVLWLTDLMIWWKNPCWPQNRRAYWIVQAIFAFLMIQATAVFGPPFWKPVVAVFIGILLGIRLLSRPSRASASHE